MMTGTEIADGVWLLPVQGELLNVYVIGDVLVDAGLPWHAARLFDWLEGRELAAHALTHAHPDHMGSSHAICQTKGIPFWVGARDLGAAEDPGTMAAGLLQIPGLGASLPRTPLTDTLLKRVSGPGHHVDRALNEGDLVGGFQVLDVPGHTRGHVAFWRESDRVLIAGDVLWNVQRLIVPPGPVNADTARLRDSVRRIAALEPAVVGFGHGPVLRDPRRLATFADGLP
jgi:glyoxylase-like metal-dependent hydrolase (beta-lactamase superfamily II)